MLGRDKLVEQVDGVPLLRRVAMRALATGASVSVTVPDLTHPRCDALIGLNVTLIPVPDAATGISASLKRGCKQLPEAARAVMILLGDLPDLTSENLLAVCDGMTTHPDALAWRGATRSGRMGHPTILSTRLLAQIDRLTGDQGAGQLLRDLGEKTVAISLPDDAACTDLDTPAQWDAWRKKHAASVR
jgi:CTP:molybdopterin cytidylyltransferase MocA